MIKWIIDEEMPSCFNSKSDSNVNNGDLLLDDCPCIIGCHFGSIRVEILHKLLSKTQNLIV